MSRDARVRSSLAVEIQGNVAGIRLQRSERVNALTEATVAGLGEFLADPGRGSGA
jgi:hypothetical protein